MSLHNGPVDWERIRLAVFDLDGTLYDQLRLRTAMISRLMVDAVRSRDLTVFRVLSAFRHCREELAEAQAADFATWQYEITAERTGCSANAVKRIVEEWIERRPLDVLRACRYPVIERVFAGLAVQNKTLAVLSDYPALDKLRVLGLNADIVAYAGDPEIGYLKPHPAGLQSVLDRAAVSPHAAIMIGDRVERDWAVAQRLGVRGLIKSKNIVGVDTFRSYDDEVFQPILR